MARMPFVSRKKRLPTRKTVRKPRMLKTPTQGLFAIQRKIPYSNIFCNGAGTISQSGAAGTLFFNTPELVAGTTRVYNIPFTMCFRLDSLQSSSDVIAIADQYKMPKVAITFKFNVSSNSPYNASGCIPYIQYYIDNDDRSIPTVAGFRTRMGVKSVYPGQSGRPSRTIIVYPKVADVIYSSTASLTNAYGQSKSQWIDTANPNVEHYGLKGCLMNMNLDTATQPNLIDYDITASLLFRGLN